LWKIPGDTGPRTVRQDATVYREAVWNYNGVGLGCCTYSSGIRIRRHQTKRERRRGMYSSRYWVFDGDLVEWDGQGVIKQKQPLLIVQGANWER
jgi:agmatine/peptidylarginine deiminase